jgi:hypothetical protein
MLPRPINRDRDRDCDCDRDRARDRDRDRTVTVPVGLLNGRHIYRSSPLGYGLAEDAIWRTHATVTGRVRSDKIMTSTC